MPFQKGQSGNPEGRPPGAKSKNASELRDMILCALEVADEGGGVEYLRKRAVDTPASFLTLIGKVLPQNINASLTVDWKAEVDEARERLRARGIEV